MKSKIYGLFESMALKVVDGAYLIMQYKNMSYNNDVFQLLMAYYVPGTFRLRNVKPTLVLQLRMVHLSSHSIRIPGHSQSIRLPPHIPKRMTWGQRCGLVRKAAIYSASIPPGWRLKSLLLSANAPGETVEDSPSSQALVPA